jgi:hypothetical protein
MEARTPPLERLAGESAQSRIAVVRIDGCIQQRTATAQRRLAFREVANERFDAQQRIFDLLQSSCAAVRNLRPGKVKRRQRELFLASKVPVNTTLFYPCCGHDLLQRASFVALLVKQGRGLRNDVLPRLVSFTGRPDRYAG